MTYWTECKDQSRQAGISVVVATLGGAAFELTKHADMPLRMAGETFGPGLCLLAGGYAIVIGSAAIINGAKAARQSFRR